MINKFRGKYYFLSNFYETDIKYDGINYRNTEAAFQAQKVLSDDEKRKFSNLDARRAKKLGRRVKLRKDWEKVKDNYMYEICLAKFSQNHELAEKLLETGDEELIEGNQWKDTYWGVYNGKGKKQTWKNINENKKRVKRLVRNLFQFPILISFFITY